MIENQESEQGKLIIAIILVFLILAIIFGGIYQATLNTIEINKGEEIGFSNIRAKKINDLMIVQAKVKSDFDKYNVELQFKDDYLTTINNINGDKQKIETIYVSNNETISKKDVLNSLDRYSPFVFDFKEEKYINFVFDSLPKNTKLIKFITEPRIKVDYKKDFKDSKDYGIESDIAFSEIIEIGEE